MSPTVFKESGYRFFFFSREEKRIHVHVISGDGEAKFWLEPEVELAKNHRKRQVNAPPLDLANYASHAPRRYAPN